jgi:hypothetical protein
LAKLASPRATSVGTPKKPPRTRYRIYETAYLVLLFAITVTYFGS